MFSTVLLLAMTAGGEAADFGKRGNGCDGGRGGLFGGGRRKHHGASNGCGGGCYGGCNGGGGGCYGGGGGCYGGSGGCYGSAATGAYAAPTYSSMPASGCSGSVAAPVYSGAPAMPAPACGGGVYHGGVMHGGSVVPSPAPGCGGVIHHGGAMPHAGVIHHGCGGVVHHGGVMHHGCGGVIHHGAPMIHGGCFGGKVIMPGGGKPIDGGTKPTPEKKIEGDPNVKPGELTATEAGWLKEMMDAEKDPAKKKEIEKEFMDEKDPAGRSAIYKLFKKESGKSDDN